ncbi:MAG: hypothetical protein R6X02_13525 [Enhygromyxa sp.]
MLDADHWLWRLSDRDWLAAAERELELGRERISTRRTAITHARRAAGMALNGVLVTMAARGWSRERCETIWGRSYVEHLRAIAEPKPSSPEPLAPEHAQACRTLLAIPVMPHTGLVSLAARRDEAASQALAAADAIVRACAAKIERLPEPSGEPNN